MVFYPIDQEGQARVWNGRQTIELDSAHMTALAELSDKLQAQGLMLQDLSAAHPSSPSDRAPAGAAAPDQPGDIDLGDAMTEGPQMTFRHTTLQIDRQQTVAAEGVAQIFGARQAVDQDPTAIQLKCGHLLERVYPV